MTDAPDDVDEYNRDERIETIYQGWGAREMAERIIDLEDELGADFDGICTGIHADVAEARAEVERLTSLVGYWEHRAEESDRLREHAGSLYEMFERLRDEESDRSERYRLAWLSARRRAADEANFGMEALEFKDRWIAQITADRNRWRSGHEAAEAQLVYERRQNARLRSFAEEVKGVHYSCRDGEPDCAERFLRRIYDSMYELWDAEREKRPFLDSVHRRVARGEFYHLDEDRESTHGPHLEHVGTDEDGEVWRLSAPETREK
jgi:hypothetical protein